MSVFRKKSWSPYLVGWGIGMLSWFSFATADRPLGITTAFENTAALLTKSVVPTEAATNSYFRAPDKKPKIDWEWALVIGVFLGSYWSSKTSGDRSDRAVPAIWERRFGRGKPLRYGAAFAGGAVMMFGARVAEGCTSGHGISGTLQFAVSSWIFVVILFASAILFSFLLYGKEGYHHV